LLAACNAGYHAAKSRGYSYDPTTYSYACREATLRQFFVDRATSSLRQFFAALAAVCLLVGLSPTAPASAQGWFGPPGLSEPAVAVGYPAPPPFAYFPYAYGPYPYYPPAYSYAWGYPFPTWPAIPSLSAQADAASPSGLLPGLGSTPCTLSSRWVPC
jgi:hypothetical protein